VPRKPGFFEVATSPDIYQMVCEIVTWNEDRSRVYVRVVQTYKNKSKETVSREGNNIYGGSQNFHFWMNPVSDIEEWKWDTYE
jgi:hypothetical protein